MLRSPSLLITFSATVLLACTDARFAPSDGGGDLPSGGEVRDGDIAGATDGPSEAPPDCPAPDLAGCVPVADAVCDPVCQVGACDFCKDKCSYVLADGALAAACRPTGRRVTAEACTVVAAGAVQQADDCAFGNICLPPFIGDGAAFCFALCRAAIDCPYGVACAPRPLSAAGGEVMVCDPQYDQCGPDGTCCDPVTGGGCPEARVCLLVAPDPGTQHSRTVCEFSYGDGRNGAPCGTARDCQVRHVCVNGHCQQVCSGAAPCPADGVCLQHGTEFGYCP